MPTPITGANGTLPNKIDRDVLLGRTIAQRNILKLVLEEAESRKLLMQDAPCHLNHDMVENFTLKKLRFKLKSSSIFNFFLRVLNASLHVA